MSSLKVKLGTIFFLLIDTGFFNFCKICRDTLNELDVNGRQKGEIPFINKEISKTAMKKNWTLKQMFKIYKTGKQTSICKAT